MLDDSPRHGSIPYTQKHVNQSNEYQFGIQRKRNAVIDDRASLISDQSEAAPQGLFHRHRNLRNNILTNTVPISPETSPIRGFNKPNEILNTSREGPAIVSMEIEIEQKRSTLDIIESDVTDMLNDQRKRKFPEKYNQIFSSKLKLGSLNQYFDRSRSSAAMATLTQPQRSMSPKEFARNHAGRIITQTVRMSQQDNDLPTRKAPLPALPIDRTIETRFSNKMQQDHQQA